MPKHKISLSTEKQLVETIRITPASSKESMKKYLEKVFFGFNYDEASKKYHHENDNKK